MAWIVKIDGNEASSDDFLLDDLSYVERVAKTPWSLANPYKDITVAKAFLRLALIRSGVSDEDADERLKTLSLGELKTAFDFVDDNAGGQQGKSQGPTTTTSRSSSGGARKGSAGPRKKSASSE
jgi:hypothetical protein